MKSPEKTNWFPLILFTFAGIGLEVYLVMDLLKEGQSIGLFKIVLLFLLLLTYMGLGWGVAKMSATIFNRKVKYPVKTQDLIVGKEYWLNGDTPAKFIRYDEYSGKLVFDVYKVGERRILPGLAREYISEILEEENQKKNK